MQEGTGRDGARTVERTLSGTLWIVMPGGTRLVMIRTYLAVNRHGRFDGAPVVAAMFGRQGFGTTAFRSGPAIDVMREAIAIDGERRFIAQIAMLFDRPVADFLSELAEIAPQGGDFEFEPHPG